MFEKASQFLLTWKILSGSIKLSTLLPLMHGKEARPDLSMFF
ncbi:hypothetical protein KP78_37310 [Jeotgalibacillus soli]|uniref:Uncharacterized protein n=1 Tax=Jeotgalibacillus soli TaxID=889306 RepID=A0A0C2V4F2_9BACL|nr:hypothetical protein KP78_37310 [Jeotgalibacillus soli]